MDKTTQETAISNQISALKVISDNIGFIPDYFPSPKDEKELQLYVHQFIDFIREEKQVEIVTEWSEGGEYFSTSWGIKDKYRDKDLMLIQYSNSKDALSTSFLESQIKAIEIVVEKLLEEEKVEESKECSLCEGKGEYTTGGSFGGEVNTHKCDCKFVNNYLKRKGCRNQNRRVTTGGNVPVLGENPLKTRKNKYIFHLEESEIEKLGGREVVKNRVMKMVRLGWL